MDFCRLCGILMKQSNEKCECRACYDRRIMGLNGADENCFCDHCKIDSSTVVQNTISEKWKDCQVDEVIKKVWEREQAELKEKLVIEDDEIVKKIKQSFESGNKEETFYIGGVDISFIKGDNVNACGAFVVITFPKLEVVYEDYQMVKLTAPYVPGFLAFREAEFVIRQFEKLKAVKPEYLPHVIFVDGNGILHPRGFGLASHLGVLLDKPCVGVAKTLIHVDGLENDGTHKSKKDILKEAGDTFNLEDIHGVVLGVALKSCVNAKNPVYVSAGHRISLKSAIWLVLKCCKYRIPEPTRQADINSREYLRKNGYTEKS